MYMQVYVDTDLDTDRLPRWSAIKSSPVNAGDMRDMGSSLGWKDPLEEEMGTHSSILARRIP